MKRTFFVVASGGHDTEAHYRDTIKNKRSLDEIRKFLTEGQGKDLKKIFKNTSFAVWGATPGESNINTWHTMQAGDYVLVYRNKKIILIGEVAYRVRNEKLAEFFWGRDGDGRTWEFIYFIINDEELDLPIKKLNQAIGYSEDYFPRGFGGIAESKIEEVNHLYGDIYDLVIRLDRGDEIKKIERTREDYIKIKEPVGEEPKIEDKEPSEHDQIQWMLIKIGLASGNDVWVARNDKSNIVSGEKFEDITLSQLPNIGLDPDSSKTVEYIDDVWLRGRRITSAFEVEHSTSIYSGILRLADLKVLQPNITFPLYITAPRRRKTKVFDELKRPTFSNEYLQMDKAVKYISYEKIRETHKNYVEKGYPVPNEIFQKMSEINS